jgi:hypothetical protein
LLIPEIGAADAFIGADHGSGGVHHDAAGFE